MFEVTIQVPDSLTEEVSSAQGRLPEALAYGLRLLPPLPNEIYQYILEFLISNPSLDEIARFAPKPEMQARASQLLNRNREGTLTASERKELDEYMRINHLVTMLKARSLSYLASAN